MQGPLPQLELTAQVTADGPGDSSMAQERRVSTSPGSSPARKASGIRRPTGLHAGLSVQAFWVRPPQRRPVS